MQYQKPVSIELCDDMRIGPSNTIDYNVQGIELLGQNGGGIFQNYLGGGDNTLLNGAALIMKSSGAEETNNVLVIGNTFTGHYDAADTYDSIQIEDTTYVMIKDNKIDFWTRYGISYNGDTHLMISGNSLNPRATHGTYSIYDNADDDASNFIWNNVVVTDMSVTSAILQYNPGYIIRNGGTAVITNPATSIEVTHKCKITPNVINVTPMSTDNAVKWWVSDIGATTFKINVDAAPATTQYFMWDAYPWNRIAEVI